LWRSLARTINFGAPTEGEKSTRSAYQQNASAIIAASSSSIGSKVIDQSSSLVCSALIRDVNREGTVGSAMLTMEK
jgi:hypothetical protein